MEFLGSPPDSDTPDSDRGATATQPRPHGTGARRVVTGGPILRFTLGHSVCVFQSRGETTLVTTTRIIDRMADCDSSGEGLLR